MASADRESLLKPQSETEQKLITLIGRILLRNPDELGIDEGFFEMGFNSLSAIQLLTAINKTFDAHLKPIDIFHHPNVRSLSNLLTTDDKSIIPPLNQDPTLVESVDEILDLINGQPSAND